jgi:S1-C subfamily serine protease
MRQSTSIRLLIFFAVCVAFAVRATPIPEIVAKAKPAVVQVIASDGNWSPIRTGTGFFVSADGELLTNFHVIQGATHISARTNKGSIFVFEKVIAQSADSDVALLKFQATDVDFLKLGNSTDAAEGEQCWSSETQRDFKAPFPMASSRPSVRTDPISKSQPRFRLDPAALLFLMRREK